MEGTYYFMLSLVIVSAALATDLLKEPVSYFDEKDQSCHVGEYIVPLDKEVLTSPGIRCRCTPTLLCWTTGDTLDTVFPRRKLRSGLAGFLMRGFLTPAPPVKKTTMSTNSPPPFTTASPPAPITTQGPTPPTTRGTTKAPPPPVG